MNTEFEKARLDISKKCGLHGSCVRDSLNTPWRVYRSKPFRRCAPPDVRLKWDPNQDRNAARYDVCGQCRGEVPLTRGLVLDFEVLLDTKAPRPWLLD